MTRGEAVALRAVRMAAKRMCPENAQMVFDNLMAMADDEEPAEAIRPKPQNLVNLGVNVKIDGVMVPTEDLWGRR